MSLVLFTGPQASGKTTLSTFLHQQTGWRYGSFGQYVRSQALALGLPVTRSALQDLGQQLVDADPTEFSRSVLTQVGWAPGAHLILDGLRHVVVLDALARIVGPTQQLCLVYLTIDPALQCERLRARGEPTAPSVLAQAATELDVGGILKTRANVLLDGDDPVRENAATILTWLRENH
jgi:dephospho-CoA kinase